MPIQKYSEHPIIPEIMKKLAWKIHAEIMDTQRIDTGILRASTAVRKINELKYIVGTNIYYSIFVEARYKTFGRAVEKIPAFIREIKGKVK